jgi:DNA-binding CsgD family transcriptional regulator/tetratricopeptide (TPR) repeat protein
MTARIGTVLGVCLGLLPASLWGQLAWESAYWDQIEQLRETPMAVQIWAEELQERALDAGECDSLNLAHAVLITMSNVNRDGASLDELMRTLPGCDTLGYATWYSIGVHHYLQQRLLLARESFERALTFSPEEKRQVSTLHAIGTLASQLGDLEGAYAAYKRAYELDPESDNPLRISNLATINMSLKDYATALDWLKLAEEAWAQRTEEMAQRLPIDFGEVILRNRLLCTYELGLWEEAERTFNRLKPGKFDGQDPIAGAAIVLNYLLRTDRFDVFNRRYAAFEEAFAVDSLRTVQALAAGARLFPPWRSNELTVSQAWNGVRNLPTWAWHHPWSGIESEAGGRDPKVSGDLEAPVELRAFAQISWATIALLAAIVGWLGWQGRKRRRARRSASAMESGWTRQIEAHAVLQSRLKSAPLDGVFEDVPWGTVRKEGGDAGPSYAVLAEHLAEWDDLTEREKEALFWILRGEEPDALAERMQCKRSHVYNLRTRLRGKLGIDAKDDWVGWWKRQVNLLLLWLAFGSVHAQQDWTSAMATALQPTERPDTLAWLSAEDTEGMEPLNRWVYHGWQALATGDASVLQQLEPLNAEAIPSSYAWLEPLVKQPAEGLERMQLTQLRVRDHLDQILEQRQSPVLRSLETEQWVNEGTPSERRIEQWRRVQWGLFALVLLAGSLLVVRLPRTPSAPSPPPVAAFEPLLEDSEVALYRTQVEEVVSLGTANAAELRAARHALELLSLPMREELAAARHRLPEVWAEFSPKERQVALLLAQRIPPQQIAEMLRYSPAYVYNLKSELRRKWGFHSSTELDRALLRLA